MQKRKLTAGLCAILMACSAGAAFIPVQAAATENPVSSSAQNYINEVAALINQERAAQGLNPLQTVPVLNQAAEIRSQELVTLFSHTRPDGRGCSTVLDDTGVSWRTTGENIAYGYDTPEAVMNGWMNSSGHRANILNANFDSVGIGVVSQNGVLYWTQIFTGGADYDGQYQPEVNPTVPETVVTFPETTETAPVQPSDICIGDSCFTCTGTDCTVPQNLLSCLTGNCTDGKCIIGGKSCKTAQDVLSALGQNCSGGKCVVNGTNCKTAQDVLSALGQNCPDGNCNINGQSCPAQNILSALNGNCTNGSCNTQNILSALTGNCSTGNCNNIQSVLQNFCK